MSWERRAVKGVRAAAVVVVVVVDGEN